MQQHVISPFERATQRRTVVLLFSFTKAPILRVAMCRQEWKRDEGKCAPATENERQIWASMDGTKTEEESGMSFASGALYFPNGSSPFPGQRGWLKRENQPGAIVAASSSIFHPHRAPAWFSPTLERRRQWTFNRKLDFVL